LSDVKYIHRSITKPLLHSPVFRPKSCLFPHGQGGVIFWYTVQPVKDGKEMEEMKKMFCFSQH
jgi:hypothetical protein